MKNMVENYRDMAKTLDLSTAEYTDEELFSLIEYWSGMDPDEQERSVMEDIEVNTKR